MNPIPLNYTASNLSAFDTGKRLRFAQRQNDGDSRSNIGKENSNQQANNPLKVAVDSILDISKTAVHVVQSVVDAVQSVIDLLNDLFKGGDSAFNGRNVHNVPFLCAKIVYSVLRVLSTCYSHRHTKKGDRDQPIPLKPYFLFISFNFLFSPYR